MRKILSHLFPSSSKIQLSKRHRPSGLNSHFLSSASSISEYIAEVRNKIEASRVDLDDADRGEIIEGNSAFDLVPNNAGAVRRGILMVHGLTDSPFVMRDLGDYFQQQGFRVVGLLLPGHGTRPGDLLDIRWDDWANELRYVLNLLDKEVDEVFLCGFSAGATLSINHALTDERIRALFVFSPALRIRSISRLACVLSRLRRYTRKAGWFDVQPDDDCFKYGSLTNNAICEVYRMIKTLDRRRAQKTLKIPVFAAASEHDSTVDSSAMLEWFEKLNGQKSMLYYSTSNTGLPADVKGVKVDSLGDNITSYSHTSLLPSPDNPHYGRQGAYRSCGHYYRLQRNKYERCKNGEADCIGEMFTQQGNCDITQRLTYNPLYSQMLSEISVFLQDIGAVDDPGD